MVAYLAKLCLLFAVMFQSSPSRLCAVVKVVTGQSCHDEQPAADGLGSDLIHCRDASRVPGTSNDQAPTCMPCQSESPVDRQDDGPRPDLAVAAAPLVFADRPARAAVAVVRVPHVRTAAVGRILPLLN